MTSVKEGPCRAQPSVSLTTRQGQRTLAPHSPTPETGTSDCSPNPYLALMKPSLLFDLDGTLVDSIELILNSARYAFVGFDGRAPNDEEWRAGIGRPLLNVLREYAPDEAEAQRLLARYREYQLENHDRLLHAYAGVVDMLR